MSVYRDIVMFAMSDQIGQIGPSWISVPKLILSSIFVNYDMPNPNKVRYHFFGHAFSRHFECKDG